MGSPESEGEAPALLPPEERLLAAALELADWDSKAQRVGRGSLRFGRVTGVPDDLLRTIFDTAKEVRENRTVETQENSL
jgi:hypothetical protein